MICSRGGLPDVIKVLDYGLVKSFIASRDARVTETRIVMGTPKFMAPERLDAPWLADPRIDDILVQLRSLQIVFPWQESEAIDWWDEYQAHQ